MLLHWWHHRGYGNKEEILNYFKQHSSNVTENAANPFKEGHRQASGRVWRDTLQTADNTVNRRQTQSDDRKHMHDGPLTCTKTHRYIHACDKAVLFGIISCFSISMLHSAFDNEPISKKALKILLLSFRKLVFLPDVSAWLFPMPAYHFFSLQLEVKVVPMAFLWNGENVSRMVLWWLVIEPYRSGQRTALYR